MSEPASRLQRILRSGGFAVTAEVVPPRSGSGATVTEQARALVGYADAVNVTDNPTGAAHMSPVAGVSFVREAGLEPTMQITCRDRNRLGLSADLLGGWALGARNLFCLTGDPITDGHATVVNDLSVNDLVRAAATLREEGLLPSGAEVDQPPRFFVGVADLPLAPNYDPARLESKLDAGADFVITQIVYDMDAFEAWADRVRARGIFQRASVIAGVAPPRSAKSARFMNDHLPGVSVPATLIGMLEGAGPDAEAEGVRLAVEIVNRLRSIAGIAGVHVMGLGREEPVRHVIEDAGLLPRPTGTA